MRSNKIRFARFGVAMRGNQPLAVVARTGGHRNFFAREFLLQPLVIGLEIVVLEIAPLAIVGVLRLDQFVGGFGKPGGLEIDAPQRIGFHGLDLAGSGIEQRQGHEIQIALVGLNISALAVSMELDHVASLKDIAGDKSA